MKRGTTDNPKFDGLMMRLNLELWEAIGLLEAVWLFTARSAPRGDIGKWTDEQIARRIGWNRTPAAEMIVALVEERWLDEHAQHRLIVHDWPEHCDGGVHLVLARSRQFFADGRRPKPAMNLVPSHEREEIQRFLAGKSPRKRTPRKVRNVTTGPTTGQAVVEPRSDHGNPNPPLSSPDLSPTSPHQTRPAEEKESGAVASLAPVADEERDERSPGSLAFAGYATAYAERYGVPPTRNAKTNAIFAQLVRRIPAAEAPEVAAFYVHHPSAYYAQRGHAPDVLLADAEKLRTEWATGRTTTTTQARRNERTAANPALTLVREQREKAARLGITPEELEERERRGLHA